MQESGVPTIPMQPSTKLTTTRLSIQRDGIYIAPGCAIHIYVEGRLVELDHSRHRNHWSPNRPSAVEGGEFLGGAPLQLASRPVRQSCPDGTPYGLAALAFMAEQKKKKARNKDEAKASRILRFVCDSGRAAARGRAADDPPAALCSMPACLGMVSKLQSELARSQRASGTLAALCKLAGCIDTASCSPSLGPRARAAKGLSDQTVS